MGQTQKSRLISVVGSLRNNLACASKAGDALRTTLAFERPMAFPDASLTSVHRQAEFSKERLSFGSFAEFLRPGLPR